MSTREDLKRYEYQRNVNVPIERVMKLAIGIDGYVSKCVMEQVLNYTSASGFQVGAGVHDLKSKLDHFLARVERPAFRMAEIATRNPDDAMDIVQDTMIKLVEKYSNKPAEEWQPLFYRILQSRIADYFRRGALHRRIFTWVASITAADDEPEETAIEPYGPPDFLMEQLTWESLITGLRALPLRQQQVFLLRTWQCLSVEETARIMKCSEGSVKTHLSRATHALMKLINSHEQDNNDDR
jgi:RNA polymerase sigma-70 factor (ECF subfamily)